MQIPSKRLPYDRPAGEAVQLITARVLGSENGTSTEPHLSLDIQVKNISYVKKVIVCWTITGETWHRNHARYSYSSGQSFERWYAHIPFTLPNGLGESVRSLRFKLAYLVAGGVFWDNQGGPGYVVKTSGEVLTGPGIFITVLEHLCQRSAPPLPLNAVTKPYMDVQRMFVRWSTDNWQTYHQTQFSHAGTKSTRNGFPRAEELASPGEPQLWSSRITPQNRLDLQYAIYCAMEQGELRDNNLGVNYHLHQRGLKVMTLNLHCMQEADQFVKFREIARAIGDKRIDVVCLQEVAEDWNDGKGSWQSNAAKILQDMLAEMGLSYHLYFEWSHIGFSIYLEGCAILSRYPFIRTDSKYLSEDTDVHNIHSRKVVMGRIHCVGIGMVDIYSLHLSWWEKGLSRQLDTLFKWVADTAQEAGDSAILLCGDFNAKPGSPGYLQVIDEDEYEDQFLKTTAPVLFSCLNSGNAGRRDLLLAHDQRIDYIFAHKKNRIRPIFGEILFDDHLYKKVSDHPGYLVEFKCANHRLSRWNIP